MMRRHDWKNPGFVLLVEDNPEDREAAVRAFGSAGVSNPVVQCEEGGDALDFLFRQGNYAALAVPPRPVAILLDLNLPGTDGFEVLEEIKKTPELKEIPVVVFTTSTDEKDSDRCRRMGADGYMYKPLDFGRLVKSVKIFKAYFLEHTDSAKKGGPRPWKIC